jgi:shikimate kinase
MQIISKERMGVVRQPNIILIGMPGAGKSTVGVLLAKALGFLFVDTDLVIQCREGQTLQTIIENSGIGCFLEIEAEVIAALDCRRTVIATGGSAIYSNSAMKHLKTNGLIVYIRLEYTELEKRVTNMATRGIAMAKDQSLRELYHERVRLYEKYADVIIDSSFLSVEETVQQILRFIHK